MIANINIKTDVETKDAATALFKQFGLNMSSAINLFLKQAVYEKRIPFELTREEIPNLITRQVIENTRKGLDLSPAYDNLDDLRKALNA